MKLVVEGMKIFIEPSAVVPVAVVLYNEEFRRLVQTSLLDFLPRYVQPPPHH
jgi:threonine dehydratase